VDEHLDPVPIGVPGELHIGGPALARGYLGNPELTARRFYDHPSRPGWQPGGGGLILHSLVPHPQDEKQIWVGISAFIWIRAAIGFARDPASAVAEPVKVVFEPSLVVRESTAPPRA